MGDDPAKARLEQLQNELAEKRKRLAEVNQARLDKVEARKKQMAERAAARGEARATTGGASSPTLSVRERLAQRQAQKEASGGDSPTSGGDLDTAVTTITRQVAEREGRRNLPSVLQNRRQQRDACKLGQESFTIFSTPPIEKERYVKGSQTDEPWPEVVPAKEETNSYSSSYNNDSSYSSPPPAETQPSSAVASPGGSDASFQSEVERIKAATEAMSPADRKRVQSNPDFYDFMSRMSLIMERALNLHIDVMLEPMHSSEDSDKLELGDRMSRKDIYFDEKWSRNKPVTSLAINPKNPELFLASYISRRDQHSTKSCGSCVLVWSRLLPQRYVQHFTCESDISTAFYCKWRPNNIIGTTYTGQIVLWDTRNSNPEPVIRSPVSAETHTHVIFGSAVLGTSNAHCLVSLSTDGRFCTWSLENMNQPQECIDLCQLVDIGESRVKRDITATTLQFLEQETNKFFVGSEDGGLYVGNRHGSASHISEKFEGHTGPITATHCHPNTGGGADFTDLILTSSMDWTCKLWSSKKNKPLASFDEFSEYVYDVKWSPIHPSSFACVDGKGTLSLWNLSQTMDVPISKLEVSEAAVNKLVWTPDGRGILTADSRGYVQLNDVMAEAALPTVEDWDKLESRVNSLK